MGIRKVSHWTVHFGERTTGAVQYDRLPLTFISPGRLNSLDHPFWAIDVYFGLGAVKRKFEIFYHFDHRKKALCNYSKISTVHWCFNYVRGSWSVKLADWVGQWLRTSSPASNEPKSWGENQCSLCPDGAYYETGKSIQGHLRSIGIKFLRSFFKGHFWSTWVKWG